MITHPALFEILKWVGPVSILCYIPVLMYLDLKYRKAPLWIWAPLIVVNITAMIGLYFNGLQLGYYEIAILWPLVIFIALWKLPGSMMGGDWLFMALAVAFCPIDPFDMDNNIFQGKLIVWFLLATIVTSLCVGIYNTVKYGKRDNDWKKQFSVMENGVPMMVPLGIAFVLSLWV